MKTWSFKWIANNTAEELIIMIQTSHFTNQILYCCIDNTVALTAKLHSSFTVEGTKAHARHKPSTIYDLRLEYHECQGGEGVVNWRRGKEQQGDMVTTFTS